MVFTSPNAGTPTYAAQGEIFQVHWDILAAALGGVGVISGCDVTQRGAGANMSVDVAAGSIMSPWDTETVVAAANVAVTAADTVNPRFDLVKVSAAGTVSVVAGTPMAYVTDSSTPQIPNMNSGDVALASIYVPANQASVITNMITDLRMIIVPEDEGSLLNTYWSSR